MRAAWRVLHQVLGLSAGLVLSIMGLTGALMSFEDEIMAAVSRDVTTVAPPGSAKLSPDTLVARVAAAEPDRIVSLLDVDARPDRATRIRVAARDGDRRSRQDLYVDPYDGRVLGPARGVAFFAAVRRLHRWMLLPGGGQGIGRQITGAAAIALVVLALSGLYLRWPLRPGRWASWFRLDLRRKGRPLLWSLHATTGTWVLPVYLLGALTGLTWSYGWYKAGATFVLTGRSAERPAAAPPAARAPGEGRPAALDPAWTGFLAAGGGRYRSALVTVPRGGGDVRIRALPEDARHPQARDEYRLDAATGAVKGLDLYGDKPLGEAMAGAMLEVHRGRFLGLPGSLVVMVAAIQMPLFFVTGLLLYLGRRRARRRPGARPPGGDRPLPP